MYRRLYGRLARLSTHSRHSKLGIARYIKNLLVDIAVVSIGIFGKHACMHDGVGTLAIAVISI